ncbi:RING finger and transmembrane domain-containing protein 2-like isoform X2 [Sceloporus undulatus]|uniref:RING finger and transmembrane domain-containing protein 2-like isoform X2 n=1 Tax=Sceloporus undulatus TaxID=8520 RepID=UPI001C4D5721|nr:RING finger and transmembrane domain-containing protein 2-like isoform X2 [Sceloporus undulatus]XP_042299683.1 RING finger and transmembrane domain-containing protein 2-like isoform X2 [Sceloporus undulatus]XP_042299692.1 RING finger and transmembrane domain-containing protein 2-like isoform X2 [Sceloporus undulatus]XP_042299699.1 RING finger and transmembrane domain-containing protein 2-like isoform X2 [Sceloporus undulatus]XP_042299707.1 RING finger and transmembrane domain-containing prot
MLSVLCFKVLRKMQRRHSSITDSLPPERSRSQTITSETSVDESGVFEGLKTEPSPPQQLFSGLGGIPSGTITATPFQSSLVLGSTAGGGEVFIQMPAPREEGTSRTEGGPYHHRQQPQHYHHSHQRGSSLLHMAGGDRHGHTEEGFEEQPGTPAPALSELKAVISWLQKGLPFIMILLAKVCFQHKLGIALCIGMASTFAYANSTLREQVSLKEKRSVLVVFWILVFLAGNTLYLLYTFSSQQLYNSLIFLKPNLEKLDFFDLMWIVGISDFVLKYLTIALKCFIVALPKIILAVKSKGKFYLVIEELSQLFRSLVPIQLWYKYIMGDDPSGSYFLGGILLIMYSLCKSFDICGRVGSIRKALKFLCTPQHIFCEECLCLWFDREKTCPLCRSVAVETLRCWKDGTTSAHFQVY